MSVNAKVNDTFKANADLSSYQYHFVVNSTDSVDRAATLNEAVCGVIQNKPESGENTTVTILGKTRVKAGATIVAGADISTTASATAITVTSGGYTVGRAVTGVASGGIFEAVINHAGVTVVA